MTIFIALLAGMIFGAGLLISGMMNPEKVIGFLDIFGEWDASLMFVMGSALLVTIPAFKLILRRERPVLNDGFTLPTKQSLDMPLLVGAAIFGIGWGLYGYCPGPAISSLASLNTAGFVFVPSMLAGMWLVNVVDGNKKSQGRSGV